MIVLDASVVIAYLDARNTHHERAVDLLTREVDDDFGISALTSAEVLVAPERDGGNKAVRTVLDALEVRELPLPDDTANTLARLRAATGLKMPDCCVLLAAEHLGARVASFDDRLGRVAAERGLDAVSD